LFRPTHARTNLPTGRHRKGPSVPRNCRSSSPGHCRRLLGSARPYLPAPTPETSSSAEGDSRLCRGADVHPAG
jgi:hypothetical protein